MIPIDETIQKHLANYSDQDKKIFAAYLMEELERGIIKAGVSVDNEEHLRIIMQTRVRTHKNAEKCHIWFLIDHALPTQAWVCGVDYKNLKILIPRSKKLL